MPKLEQFVNNVREDLSADTVEKVVANPIISVDMLISEARLETLF